MACFITEDCIGCGACKRSCPVFAIAGEAKERHVVNRARCIECFVCGRVCPKEAVEDPSGLRIGRVPKDQWAKPVINEELCSACAICVESCSAEALRIAMPKFKGDIDVSAELFAPEKCVACSLCERRCPLKAIELLVPVGVKQ